MTPTANAMQTGMHKFFEESEVVITSSSLDSVSCRHLLKKGEIVQSVVLALLWPDLEELAGPDSAADS